MRHPEGLDSDAFDCSLALLDRLMKMSGDNNDSRGGCRHVVAMVIRSTLCAHDIAQVMPCHKFETCFHDYANLTLTPCILSVYCVYSNIRVSCCSGCSVSCWRGVRPVAEWFWLSKRWQVTIPLKYDKQSIAHACFTLNGLFCIII